MAPPGRVERGVDFAPSRPVPVFPLPDAVLFPRARMPLHVFELRYRTMVREALSSERLIAMALLAPGWERDYHGSPRFLPLGCVGRIDRVEWLPNDCYNLQVVGVCRVRFHDVVREFPYRACRVEAMADHPYPEDDPLVRIEKQALWEAYQQLRRGGAPLPRTTQPVPDTDFATLVNGICTFAEIEPSEKFALLGLDSVIERGRRVRACIEKRLRKLVQPEKRTGGELN